MLVNQAGAIQNFLVALDFKPGITLIFHESSTYLRMCEYWLTRITAKCDLTVIRVETDNFVGISITKIVNLLFVYPLLGQCITDKELSLLC